jgi:uncharacterized protein (TIGR02284 family)
MSTDTKDVVSTLNGLIETCKDGENGFKKASEEAKEPSLQALFAKYSAQRTGYSRELQQAVASLGEKPAESGHVAATLHRGWMTLKESLSKHEDTAIIDEAEAGEDAAVKAYREALAKDLPTTVLEMVRRQFAGIQEAHGTIRDLKHSRHRTASATV